MKRRLIFALLLPAAALGVQGSFRYTDTAGTLTIVAKSAILKQIPGVYRFTLRESVSVSSMDDGTTMTASRVQLDAVPMRGNPGNMQVSRATASGNLQITKIGGGLSSKLTGSSGDYVNRGGEGLVNLKGPVTITNLDSGKAQTLRATGSSATATLAAGQQSGLKTATLLGPVRANLVQAPVGANKGGTVVATGSRMVLNNAARPATITLTGNVVIEGRGPGSFGVIRGVGKAVLTLNEKGQVSSFQTEGG